MAHIYPRQWNAFCDKVHPGIKPPCGQTEFYPSFGRAKFENAGRLTAHREEGRMAPGPPPRG
jgi:hypothetical protein